MANPTRGVSNGPNSRPLDETIAQSGPGIPDDALCDGYDPLADAAESAGEEREPTPPGPDTLFNGP